MPPNMLFLRDLVKKFSVGSPFGQALRFPVRYFKVSSAYSLQSLGGELLHRDDEVT